MSVQLALLGLLEQQPRHGYDLKRLVDRYFAPDHRCRSRRSIRRSAGSSSAGGSSSTASSRPRAPTAGATRSPSEGTRELERWLDEPLDPEPHLQASLFTKVVLAILSGRPVETLVDAERHAHLERMRELTAVRRTAPMPIALLADYALFHLEADLRWLDLTAARVDDLAPNDPRHPEEHP